MPFRSLPVPLLGNVGCQLKTNTPRGGSPESGYYVMLGVGGRPPIALAFKYQGTLRWVFSTRENVCKYEVLNSCLIFIYSLQSPHFMLKSPFPHLKIIYNTIISKSGRVFEIVVRYSQVANQFYKTAN